MKAEIKKVLISGIVGGVAMVFVMILTFRLIGFGWDGGGILLDPSVQSQKLIAVWTEIKPIPLIVSNPAPMFLGFILFGIVHAYIYAWLSPAWPTGIFSRATRLASLVFILSFVFFEFFTPFNMFGEPLPLLALQLVFWGIIASAEGLAIAIVMERN